MTLTIELTPEEETHLQEEATLDAMEPSAYVHRLIAEDLAHDRNESGVKVRDRRAPKTAGWRLMDLLAGWANFVGNDRPPHDGEADEIYGFYQEVGQWAFDVEGEAERERVKRFVLERVLPILLR